jgi:hypothetical protein
VPGSKQAQAKEAAEAEAARKAAEEAEKAAEEAAKVSEAAGNAAKAKAKAKAVLAEAKPPADIKIWYTLDGRDPFLAGDLYTGPFSIEGHTGPVTLRTVAHSRSRRWRSPMKEVVFTVCDYVLPHEVITGTLSADIFPEAEGVLREQLALALETPKEQVLVQAASDSPSCDQKWLTLGVHTPKPKQRLYLHQKYATIRKNEKMAKQFMEKVTKDLAHKKACNARPEDASLLEHEKNIAMDFAIDQSAVAELLRQLSCPESYLRNQGKLRGLWANARLEPRDLLGDLLRSAKLADNLRFSLGKKASPEAIAGLGEGYRGVLAFKVANAKEGKKLKTNLGKAIKECLPSAVADDQVKESLGTRGFQYIVDVVKSPGRVTDEVVQRVQSEDFSSELSGQMTEILPATVRLNGDTASQRLDQVEVHFKWRNAPTGPTEAAPIQDHPDIVCLLYGQSRLLSVVDTKTADCEGGGQIIAGPIIRGFTNVDVRFANGALYVAIKIAELSPLVTDIYFALSAFESDDLQSFLEPKAIFRDVLQGRELTVCEAPACDGPTKSAIICSMSRSYGGNWVVQGIGAHCEGSVRDIGPFTRIVADRQARYDRWERRAPFVHLRVLHKLQWLSRSSSSRFAQLLWFVLDLPVPVFQVLCSWL